MILFYAAACAAVLSWRLQAQWRAWVAKRSYERAETLFRDAERLCKLDEVQMGRPVDYARQLRLLKAFESREIGKGRWSRAATAAARAKRAWAALRGYHGRRVSYLSGAADAGLAWLAYREVARLGEWSAQATALLATLKRWW